ncbi:MAG: hypothetical protein M3Y87_26295 [Myxococcota bacterium]|nr:hypothetical protein [Myxococcota bacterium]
MPRAAWLEVAIAAVAAMVLTWVAPVRLYAAIAEAGLDAVLASLALARIDPPTVGDAAIASLRSLLIVTPIVVAFARAERIRLVWAPLTIPPLVLALALAPHGIVGLGPLSLLALISLCAIAAQARPWLRGTAALPMLMALHPTATTHQRWAAELAGGSERLVARCASNDGERPVGLRPSHLSPVHYSVTPVGESRLLLTSEGGRSHWVVREPDGRLRIAGPSSAAGNYWEGTEGEGITWLAHRDDVRGVRWVGDHEEVTTTSLLDVREPWEVDALDAVYDETTRSVFVGELASGSLLRVPIDGRPSQRHELGLFYLQLVPAGAGELVGISTTELTVIDTVSGTIRERQPAAMCAGGVAICPDDLAVAVADLAGRVRLFERDVHGHYAFVRSGAARSPRRITFSPDCRALAVTSADDETVVVLSREDLSVVRTYRLGPGLRDVHWLSGGDLLVVDACTVSRLRAERPGVDPVASDRERASTSR